jgi:hypothetical protein
MFEIRALDVPDHLYSTAGSLEEAERYVEDLVALTRAQVAAGGEGCRDGLRVSAAIYRDDGELMITWIEWVHDPLTPGPR